MEFIITKKETFREILEIPIEEDGTVTLETLQSQYPGAIGLKYKGENGNFRAVKMENKKLYVTKKPDDIFIVVMDTCKYYYRLDLKNLNWMSINFHGCSWKSTLLLLITFFCFSAHDSKTATSTATRTATNMTKIFKVENLPWTTSEEEVKTLFSQYGVVQKAIIAKKRKTGQPLGYGFIQMKDIEGQKMILAKREFIFKGRCINIKKK